VNPDIPSIAQDLVRSYLDLVDSEAPDLVVGLYLTGSVALDRWTRQNLEEYWRPWHTRFGQLVSRDGWASLGPWATEWGVLGVSRLHYTLVSGQITSKHGAGLYAMRRFPVRCHRVIIEALRIRRDDGGRSLYRTPFGRRRDLLACVSMVIDDGLALPPR